MWGSKEFDKVLLREIRKQSKQSKSMQKENPNFLVNKEYPELIKINEVDPSFIDYMLLSGGYRYATEEEVTKHKLKKKIKNYI